MTNHQPEILKTLEQKVVPAHTALLVIDMQNDLADPAGKTAVEGKRDLTHSRRIIPKLKEFIDTAREAGVMIIFVQGTTLQDERGMSGPWLDAREWAAFTVRDICLDGSWGQEIIPELEPQASDVMVKKYRYGAFAGTTLDMILRTAGCKTVICAGVSTNACVESTAREAFSLDYYVVYAEDVLGSWSQKLHEATLENAAKRYASVVKVSELEEAWRR